MNFWHDISTGVKVPEQINVIVETPKNSQNKYEHDKKNNVIKLDRVLFSSVVYPGDYGLIPQTLAPDNDPLDALVIVTNPNYPGVLIESRPIGVLKMLDNGEGDDKIICVPIHDNRFASVHEMSDLPEGVTNEIAEFFRSYKNLENKEVKIGDWQNADAAREMIIESMETYKKRYQD